MNDGEAIEGDLAINIIEVTFVGINSYMTFAKKRAIKEM
jgi:hypothetical protein